MQSNTNTKLKKWSPLRGLNAMPLRTVARNCNHWATGELHDMVKKFNGTYMHMKCSCIDSLIYVWKMCNKRNDRPNGV